MALLCVGLGLALGAAGLRLPSGAVLEVRLKTPVASNSSKPGDRIEAVLVRPVVVSEQIALPAGLVVRAEVADVSPAGPEKRAVLALDKWRMLLRDDKPIELPARLIEVDNARESVDEKGAIVGILASETISARLDRAIGRVSQSGSSLGALLKTVKDAVLKEPDPEISYAPGVELILELTQDLTLDAARLPAAPELPGPIEPADRLYELVNAQPFQTTAEKTPKPSDLTNLMFLGTEEQLVGAFREAGWTTAAKLDAGSGLETFRAIAEARGYQEAPMSVLLLEGKRADWDFQKQLNTFAKRHHLRIWRRPDTFEDRPVWVCAATHDIGIEFSPENRTFIHKIDSRIDRERAKVVNDLVFAGRVAALALVERPAAPRQSMNATGDKLETDGRMAVLLLR